jgi:hypothetical protein
MLSKSDQSLERDETNTTNCYQRQTVSGSRGLHGQSVSATHPSSRLLVPLKNVVRPLERLYDGAKIGSVKNAILYVQPQFMVIGHRRDCS